MGAPATLNKYGLEFHHVGLGVDSPEFAVPFLTGLGYSAGEALYDPLQNVHLLMCDHPSMPSIEVVYPAEGAGPLNKLLTRHKGGLVYHLCYTSAHVDSSIKAMEADGQRVFCIAPPKAAVLFGGKEVSFYNIAGMGLIEIIQDGGA